MKPKHCISLEAEIDAQLHQSLSKYLDLHPYWDLNRVINASLSLFLLQNWHDEQGREHQDCDNCTRVYLDSIFQEYRTYLRYEQKN